MLSSPKGQGSGDIQGSYPLISGCKLGVFEGKNHTYIGDCMVNKILGKCRCLNVKKIICVTQDQFLCALSIFFIVSHIIAYYSFALIE